MTDTRTYAIMAKPVGSRCNLRCDYCYYLDKPAGALMDDELLEEYTKQVIAVHGRDAEIEFAWHGGEPTLAGTAFFEKAAAFQKIYGKGRVIRNSLQTNATLLDDELCRFFREHGFLLGVSVDGPEELHNRYRGNTFTRVMEGIELLRKHGVPFNTLTAVHAGNCSEPERVYAFLSELTDHMQFLPVVEFLPTACDTKLRSNGCEPETQMPNNTASSYSNFRPLISYEKERGLRFSPPPGVYSRSQRSGRAAEFSLKPDDFGKFLCGILNVWKREDAKFVQLFETTLGAILGQKGGVCSHEAICGHCACVLENGDVYCCDRYCHGNYRLGNIRTEPLGTLLEKNREFGMYKTYSLTDKCYDCEYVRLCFGGCPKDRVFTGAGGADGGGENHNYLCESYRRFFATFSLRRKRLPGFRQRGGRNMAQPRDVE